MQICTFVPCSLDHFFENPRHRRSAEKLSLGIFLEREADIARYAQTHEKPEDLIKFPSNTFHFVFSFPGSQFIYKMLAAHILIAGQEKRAAHGFAHRYHNNVTAATLIEDENLDTLVIPHMGYYTLASNDETIELLVEQKLPISPSRLQISDFNKHIDELSITIIQLAHFICLSGFSDVHYGNIPLLCSEETTSCGSRKIALIDLEAMGNDPGVGLFGLGFFSRGLAGCVATYQLSLILKVAKQYNIVNCEKRAALAFQMREEELKKTPYRPCRHIKNTPVHHLARVDSFSLDSLLLENGNEPQGEKRCSETPWGSNSLISGSPSTENYSTSTESAALAKHKNYRELHK